MESETEDSTPTIENATVIYQELPDESPDVQDVTSQQVPPVATSAAPTESEWLPLGTYSLAPSTATSPTAMLQLAVNRAGQLTGVYYDAITNSTQNVTGTLDRATQAATWWFDNNPQTTFNTSLEELLNPASTVGVSMATGQQEWQLTRVDG